MCSTRRMSWSVRSHRCLQGIRRGCHEKGLCICLLTSTGQLVLIITPRNRRILPRSAYHWRAIDEILLLVNLFIESGLIFVIKNRSKVVGTADRAWVSSRLKPQARKSARSRLYLRIFLQWRHDDLDASISEILTNFVIFLSLDRCNRMLISKNAEKCVHSRH